jgi:LacI family transcriptional regulator
VADFANSLEVPIVDITHQLKGFNVPRIHENDKEIGIIAAKHLIDLGFKNFAYHLVDNLDVSCERCSGFMKYVKESGFNCDEIYRRKKRYEPWLDRRKWLAKELEKLEKPAAVFCVDDRLAVSIIEVAMECNISVPNQLAVIGVGNLELATECSRVPVSSISVDFEEMGYQAASILDKLMRGKELEENLVKFPPSGVTLRKSTDTMAISDPVGSAAIQYIFDNYQNNIGVDDIANSVGVKNRRQLNYIMKKELGDGPAGVLESVRLRKAVKLLKETELSVRKIAIETGFGTSLRFQRSFKRNYNVAPGVYRKNLILS